MNIFKFGSLFTAAIMIISFSACSSEQNTALQETGLFAMDTYMTLKANGKNADTALKLAEERIRILEAELSVTDVESDIGKINSSNGIAASVSDDTAELISAGISYGEKTSGALDISIYPVLSEWGFTTGEYHIPTEKKLAELLENVDYSQVRITDNDVVVPEDYKIDLGALAKGYTGDKIMEVFRENDVNSAVISLGGNVQTLGSKPDGTDWRIGVKDPFSPDIDFCVISVKDKAVVTSGNYERCFTGDDGNQYWHIIDPQDGYPADNGLVSVTIIGNSGLMCDALSTALFIMGTDKAVSYWKEHNDFDMILVTDDARVLYTEGISEKFDNTGNMTSEVITNE